MLNPLFNAQEEDSKSLMSKDRRRDAIKLKLQRLEAHIAKTRKDCEGKFSQTSEEFIDGAHVMSSTPSL